MMQITTAKLNLTQEQKEFVRQVSLSYQDGLNCTSQVAFENNKLSSPSHLQKLVYYDIRGKLNRTAQMSCNVLRQVAATYKSQWTKFKRNQQAKEQCRTKKRYEGLDKPQKFTSRTAKAKSLQRFLELRWSLDTSSDQARKQVRSVDL